MSRFKTLNNTVKILIFTDSVLLKPAELRFKTWKHSVLREGFVLVRQSGLLGAVSYLLESSDSEAVTRLANKPTQTS